MHEDGWAQANWSGKQTFDGKSLSRHIQPIAVLVRETGAGTLLDYGSGKAKAYAPYPGEPADARFKSPPELGHVKAPCHDHGYSPFSRHNEPPVHRRLCTHLLSHPNHHNIPH